MTGLALVAALWAATGLVFTVGTAAQSVYPDKLIKMIVNFRPGGVAETVAPPVAEALSCELKQPVIVENRVGAGGALGIGMAAHAPADGYTVLLSLSSISILPEADKILGRKPPFALNRFKSIARLAADPTVLVVRADAPRKSLAELVADTKARPGQYSLALHPLQSMQHAGCSRLAGSARRRCSRSRSDRRGAAEDALAH